MKKIFVDVMESIACLELSPRAENGLKRMKLETIQDVINFSNINGLNSIRNLGDKSIREIEKKILDKCNVSIVKDGYADLRTLNLSSRAFNVLIKKFSVTTMSEVLNLCVNKNHSSKYLDSSIKSEKEIIEKVHELGYVFIDEKSEVFSLEDDISKLNFSHIVNLSFYNYGVHTIDDLLHLSLEKNVPRNEKGIYNVRGFGDKKVKELVDLIHSIGFQFDCEYYSDDNKKKIFYNEFNGSYPNFDNYEFFYRSANFNKCIFLVSKNLVYGSRRYRFDFDIYSKGSFLESLSNDLSICHLNFDLSSFVHEEFAKFLNHLDLGFNRILEFEIHKIFQKDVNPKESSMDLNNQILSQFRNFLNEGYVKNYIYSLIDSKKETLKENDNYKNLMSLFDKIILFVEFEENQLKVERDELNLGRLLVLKEDILRERDDLYNEIINYYFSKNEIESQIRDYYLGVVDSFIDDIQKTFIVEQKIGKCIVDLDVIFSLLPETLVNEEFYDQVSSIDNDMTNSQFVVDFVRLVNKVCCKEDGSLYSSKEIVMFLRNKLMVEKDMISKIMGKNDISTEDFVVIHKMLRKL